MGATHWTQFHIKSETLFYFDSPGGPLYTFLLQQLTKAIFFPIFNIQDKISQLRGKICLQFFYQIKGTDFYDAVLKTYFGQLYLVVQ